MVEFLTEPIFDDDYLFMVTVEDDSPILQIGTSLWWSSMVDDQVNESSPSFDTSSGSSGFGGALGKENSEGFISVPVF